MDFLYDFKQANRDRYEDAGFAYTASQVTHKNPVKRVRNILTSFLHMLVN